MRDVVRVAGGRRWSRSKLVDLWRNGMPTARGATHWVPSLSSQRWGCCIAPARPLTLCVSGASVFAPLLTRDRLLRCGLFGHHANPADQTTCASDAVTRSSSVASRPSASASPSAFASARSGAEAQSVVGMSAVVLSVACAGSLLL